MWLLERNEIFNFTGDQLESELWHFELKETTRITLSSLVSNVSQKCRQVLTHHFTNNYDCHKWKAMNFLDLPGRHLQILK